MEQKCANTRTLLRLLQENDMPDQARELRELLDFVTDMERKCGELLEELNQVKEQLSRLEDKRRPADAAFETAEKKVRTGVERARDQLRKLRQTIEDGAGHVVEGFRRAGASALHKVVEVLGVRKLLSGVQEELGRAAAGTQRAVERLESMGNELRAASGHLRNAGRAAAGHTPRQEEQRPEGRFQSAVLFPMRGVRKTLAKMQIATATAMYHVARFEQGQADQGQVFALPAPGEEQRAGEESTAFAMTM